MRYANFVMKLSEHNSHGMKQYEKDKTVNKRRVLNALTKLEELKPKLVAAYDAEIEKERIRLLQKDEEDLSDDANDDAINAPSSPDVDDPEEEEEQKQMAKAVPSPNRWNNLKMESSSHFKKEEALAPPKSQKHG